MTENSSTNSVISGDTLFSNKNHLEWNQKKHDIMLSLALTNNNSETDQTPTPTRFIQNCEEVGLFQDLQNVNPFDEVFKKAVEDPSSVKKVTANSPDDTLHTPQIYPQLEEQNKYINNSAGHTSEKYTLNNVIPNIEQERDKGDNPLIIAVDSDNDKNQHITENVSGVTSKINSKFKKNNTNQARQEVIAALSNKINFGINLIKIEKLERTENQEKKDEQNENVEKIIRQREANKAAQTRCRKRKQREFEEMSSEIQYLRQENIKLSNLNLVLQETIKKLEAELKASRSPIIKKPNDLSTKTTPNAFPENTGNKKSVEDKTKPAVSSKETKKKSSAPNQNTVVIPIPINPLPNSNNSVLVVCPGYSPTQISLIQQPIPQSLIVQSTENNLGYNKSNFKKIVPKLCKKT